MRMRELCINMARVYDMALLNQEFDELHRLLIPDMSRIIIVKRMLSCCVTGHAV